MLFKHKFLTISKFWLHIILEHTKVHFDNKFYEIRLRNERLIALNHFMEKFLKRYNFFRSRISFYGRIADPVRV